MTLSIVATRSRLTGEVESQALRAYVIAQSHRGLAVQKAAADKETTP
jgi:hypothetical protein